MIEFVWMVKTEHLRMYRKARWLSYLNGEGGKDTRGSKDGRHKRDDTNNRHSSDGRF